MINKITKDKTASEKLKELGFRHEYCDILDGPKYKKDDLVIFFDVSAPTCKVYSLVDNLAHPINLELSRVITQYLDEIENGWL